MNILLIDADSKIPNIALMKLSTHYKNKNDFVTLIRLNIPYYPNRIKQKFIVPTNFDKVYCSVIFEDNKKYIIGENVIFGGTGVDLTIRLPENIENCEPDYSIYPDNNISYGFITRGCIRNCSFCKVPKKEGYIHKVNEINDIIKHKKVKFLDNNILAYSQHKKILCELILKNIKCQFNQGLDIRLIDRENSQLLSQLNYFGEYIFAFDSWSYKNLIEEKVKLLNWKKDWQLKFFVYIHPNMELNETINRINWLKERKCLPYIMRDILCWNSNNSNFYIDLAAYCNQPNLFKKLDFKIFLERRYKNKNRILNSLNKGRNLI